MKHFRGIPIRIFLIVLLSGIMSVFGIVLIRYEINQLTDNFDSIMDEHVENRDRMAKILELVYQHRSVVSDCFLIKDEKKRDELRVRESLVRTNLQKNLNEFGVRVKGDEKEIQYHSLYSGLQKYLGEVQVVMELYEDGNTETAASYISSNLPKAADMINEQIKKLDTLTVSEMEDAKQQLKRDETVVRVSVIIFIILVTGSACVSLLYCVNAATSLDKKRDELEIEVKRQTEELEKRSERVVEMKEQTIIGMANLIENRDGDTGGHIKRTSLYVELLARTARKIGYCRGILTDRYIELLIKAAPMHDVGKIVVPDHILKKPGRLTDEEFEQIKLHASEGDRIVKEVLGGIEDSDYVQIAAEIAGGHHEKWDGSGYPCGKKEEEIPLCARIMAIADVYDALVAKRCYKESMSYEDAMAVIEESAGVHFDPTLAKFFVDMRDEVQKISESFKD